MMKHKTCSHLSLRRGFASASVVVLALALLNACATSTSKSTAPSLGQSAAGEQQATVQAAGDVKSKGAVIAGDYPDPSMIHVGDDYWAVATSSAWAPIFPILHSNDLANWTQESAVFTAEPTWSKGDYWAPEIAHLEKTFYVFYAARNKKTSKMCVAVATSRSALGPYQDHGPLVCGAIGAIDPAVFTDDDGQTYLTWKDDGNSVRKPTPIKIQKFDLASLKVVQRAKTAITNDVPWERELVEGPYILKRSPYYYLFYSGNGCCTRNCNYALGVARAKKLEGPWEKNPANPILKENEFWKCPGHGSIAQDSAGRDFIIYHAYNRRDGVYVGRQAMIDQVDWSTTGWPTINGGHGPSLHADGVFGHPLKNAERVFNDDFQSKTLKPGWIWPASTPARFRLITMDPHQDQELALSAQSNGAESVLARATTEANYTAQTTIDRTAMKPGATAALAIYGDAKNAIGMSYRSSEKGEDTIQVWSRDDGHTIGVESLKLRDVLNHDPKDSITLQVRMEDGHIAHFSVSDDQAHWQPVGQLFRDAFAKPPWDLGLRVALIARSGEARFQDFQMKPALWSKSK